MNQNDSIQIVEPDEAAIILQAKLDELTQHGWIILIQTDYTARLTRGDKNLDVRVDLLGELSVEEKPLTDVQKIGQVVAIILILVSILVLLTLVSALGFLD